MNSAVLLLVIPIWFFALLGGAMAALAVSQAVTGRPTHPLMAHRADWSVSELKILGLGWAIHWLVLAAWVLFGSIWIVTFQSMPLGRVGWIPIGVLVWLPVLSLGPVFQILMDLRHEGRWPFKRQVRT